MSQAKRRVEPVELVPLSAPSIPYPANFDAPAALMTSVCAVALTARRWSRVSSAVLRRLRLRRVSRLRSNEVPGGRRSREKGNRLERALARALQDAGFCAERVPLSGAARGRFGGDLSVPLLGIDRRVEVKARADGFRQLYEWLDGADLLIVRADHSEPLVVVPFHFATEIAKAAENSRTRAMGEPGASLPAKPGT
jgi:hypothetical protein